MAMQSNSSRLATAVQICRMIERLLRSRRGHIESDLEIELKRMLNRSGCTNSGTISFSNDIKL